MAQRIVKHFICQLLSCNLKLEHTWDTRRRFIHPEPVRCWYGNVNTGGCCHCQLRKWFIINSGPFPTHVIPGHRLDDKSFRFQKKCKYENKVLACWFVVIFPPPCPDQFPVICEDRPVLFVCHHQSVEEGDNNNINRVIKWGVMIRSPRPRFTVFHVKLMA